MRAYTFTEVSSSQMHSCEIYEVLQNIIFKEDCWATISDLQHFGRITCSLVLSTIDQLIQN